MRKMSRNVQKGRLRERERAEDRVGREERYEKGKKGDEREMEECGQVKRGIENNGRWREREGMRDEWYGGGR